MIASNRLLNNHYKAYYQSYLDSLRAPIPESPYKIYILNLQKRVTMAYLNKDYALSRRLIKQMIAIVDAVRCPVLKRNYIKILKKIEKKYA
ncbi:MAG: hypothetical protein ACFFCS_12820 [Candidatus Hodarchaeota archaeon]